MPENSEANSMPPASLDPAHQRDVLGHYPTGVAVVTGLLDGAPVGMVVGTFSSVSLEPALVSFMPQTSSRTWTLLAEAESLCINVLAHDQLELCRLLAMPAADKFEHVDWSLSPWGAPQVEGAVAHVHCRVDRVVEAGDHLIVLCAVQAMSVDRPVTPLLFFQGGYGGFSATGLSAKADCDVIAALRLADRARGGVERLARDINCEAAVLVAVGPDELTTAVSAHGGRVHQHEALGHRIPLVPPIGEAYVAGSSPEVVERWLAKVPRHEADLLPHYRARLESVAADGHAVSVVSAQDRAAYAELGSALLEYASGELTPARERAIRSAFTRTRGFFATVELAPDELYDVGSVVVPVRDRRGEVLMVLRLTQLPASVPGRVVEEWIAAVKKTARLVERDLAHGAGAHRADDYLTWGADFMM